MKKRYLFLIVFLFTTFAFAASAPTTISGDLNILGNLFLKNQTASTVPYIDSNKEVQSSSTTPTELGFVHNVTSSLCGINQSCTETNKTYSGSSNTFTNIPLSSAVTGVLGQANGGTGNSSYTDGQLLIGNTSTTGLSVATLTAGSNVTITNGHGTISISSTASGAAPLWSYVSQSSTLNPAVLGDYYLLSGASFTITLPTAASVAGQGVVFRHNGTSLTQAYTLNTTSAQTIGGVASGAYILQTSGETLQLVSDGSNWQIVSHQTATPWVNSGANFITATSAYTFTITSATVVSGDTYTNNSQTFIVATSGTVTSMPTGGTGAPLSSGTLTRASGTGPATLTFSAVTSTGVPALGTATVVVNKLWWRRVANEMQMRLEFGISAPGTAAAGSGDYLFQLPAGASIDTTQITPYNGAGVGINAAIKFTNIVGTALASSPATPFIGTGSVSVYSGTYVRLFIDFATAANGSGFGAVSSSLMALTLGSGVYYGASYSIPIVGWQP